MTGADYIARILEAHRVSHVFGLPGSQNGTLYTALRRSSIETFVATNEMAAGFAALGYAAASDQPAVMAIIGGPGFTFAATPLQEAHLDSIPLVCLVFVRRFGSDKPHGTQYIDYHAIAGAVCKATFEAASLDDLAPTLERSMAVATEGEPGPVAVLIDSELLAQRCRKPTMPGPWKTGSGVDPESVENVASRIRGKRVLLIAGRGTTACADELMQLAERIGAPVLTSTSARGVVPESHPLAVRSDLAPAKLVNDFVNSFDCLLAIGIKFSENSTRGFRLNLEPGKLIHVDRAGDVTDRAHEASLSVTADAPAFVKELLKHNLETIPAGRPTLDSWRRQFQESLNIKHDYLFSKLNPPTSARFFELLQSALPENAVVVTDSGKHQVLTRKYYISLKPGGLLVPTGFQSMGYGVPVAIGVRLAQPSRTVVALIGDGGLQISGLELATAVRAKLSLPVIVFNDGHFGQIRHDQLSANGEESGVALPAVDFAALAKSVGGAYEDGSADPAAAVTNAMERPGPTIIEIVLDDPLARRQKFRARGKQLLKRNIRRLAGMLER